MGEEREEINIVIPVLKKRGSFWMRCYYISAAICFLFLMCFLFYAVEYGWAFIQQNISTFVGILITSLAAGWVLAWLGSREPEKSLPNFSLDDE